MDVFRFGAARECFFAKYAKKAGLGGSRKVGEGGLFQGAWVAHFSEMSRQAASSLSGSAHRARARSHRAVSFSSIEDSRQTWASAKQPARSVAASRQVWSSATHGATMGVPGLHGLPMGWR